MRAGRFAQTGDDPANGGTTSRRMPRLRHRGWWKTRRSENVGMLREPQARSRARSDLPKMREIGRVVDIQCDTGQAHDRRLDAGGASGGEVRAETVIAKAQSHR